MGAVLVVGGADIAWSQARAPRYPADTPSPAQDCAKSQLPQAQQGQKGGETTGDSLSDQLAQSRGVICPPSNFDPKITAPTPNVGRMPVIPAPGTPGGDPNVQPK